MDEDTFYSILADSIFSCIYLSQSKWPKKCSGARPRLWRQLRYSWSHARGYGQKEHESLYLLLPSEDLKNKWINFLSMVMSPQ